MKENPCRMRTVGPPSAPQLAALDALAGLMEAHMDGEPWMPAETWRGRLRTLFAGGSNVCRRVPTLPGHLVRSSVVIELSSDRVSVGDFALMLTVPAGSQASAPTRSRSRTRSRTPQTVQARRRGNAGLGS
jgi:hypothetical protein